MHKITLSLLLGLTAAAPAAAQRLLAGGPNTLIHEGLPTPGDLQIVGACGGVVASMVSLEDTTYIGDVTGRIYKHSPATGVGYAFDATVDATSLAVHGGQLLVGGSGGTIERYNLASQTLIGTLTSQFPIQAMLVIDNMLYVGGPQGVVFRTDLAGGAGFSFWGTCGGPIHSMTTDGLALILGTTSGVVYRVSLVTQAVSGSFALPGDNVAMGMHMGDLLAADSTGTIRRVDAVTGFVHHTLALGMELSALSLTEGMQPGLTYCYGFGCPCGNDDPSAGCANSLGAGALLRAAGTSSVAADGLTLFVTGAPANQFGIFYMGLGNGTSTIGDGVFCTATGASGYGNYRFGVTQAGPGGFFEQSNFRAYAETHFDPVGQIVAGSAWHFQLWYRDPGGPCGTNFNTTNGLAVVFTP